MLKELILVFTSMVILTKGLFVPNNQVTIMDDNKALKYSGLVSPLLNNQVASDLSVAATNYRSGYSGWRYGNSDRFGSFLPSHLSPSYGVPVSQSGYNYPSRSGWGGYGRLSSYGEPDYVRPGWQGK